MKKYTEEITYTGEWVDGDGKKHNIVRVTCNKCGEIISEFHQCCCGHSSSGFSSNHKCNKASIKNL